MSNEQALPLRHTTRHFAINGDVSVSLSHYKPRARQHRHSHEFNQLSFLLNGEMRENHGRTEWIPDCSAFGWKPAGLTHDNEWGAGGALVFSVKISSSSSEIVPQRQPGWSRPAARGLIPSLVRGCLEPSDATAREDAVWDIVSLVSGAEDQIPRSPPVWLSSAREAIRDSHEGTSIAEIARLVGVHRAHLSCAFQTFYGTSPSAFRRDVMISRALSAVVDSRFSLTEIAHEVGFSDQAHLSRLFRKASGITPRQLRTWLG